jgi:16S rRNA (cytosine967-C5)-methyltransferase
LLDQVTAPATGRAAIVYATCSILPRENEDRVGAFLARHPAFAIRPAAAIWRESVGAGPPPGASEFFRASPLSTGTDGFFAAVLARA